MVSTPFNARQHQKVSFKQLAFTSSDNIGYIMAVSFAKPIDLLNACDTSGVCYYSPEYFLFLALLPEMVKFGEDWLLTIMTGLQPLYLVARLLAAAVLRGCMNEPWNGSEYVWILHESRNVRAEDDEIMKNTTTGQVPRASQSG